MRIDAHRSPVTSVDVAANGYVSGSYDCHVIMWENDGTARWRFAARDLINDVRFSPDCQYVAVASADGVAYVLDVVEGVIVASTGDHADDVNAVAWSPDGRFLATVTDALATDVLVWDWRAGSVAIRLVGHNHGVFAVEFSPSGDFLVTAAEDSTARVWDRSGKLIHTFAHPFDPETATWLTDSRVVTGCEDGVIREWDAVGGSLIRPIKVSDAAVRSVRRSVSGEHLLVGSYDGQISVLSADSLEVSATYTDPHQWERSLALAADGTLVAGSFGDRPLVRRPQVVTSPNRTYGVNRLVLAADLLLACLDSGHVIDVRGGDVITRHSSIVNGAHISRQDAAVVVYSGDYLGDLKKSVLSQNQSEYPMWAAAGFTRVSGGPINAIAETDDGGGLVFAANYAGHLVGFTSDLVEEIRFTAHDGPIKDVAVYGGLLYTAGADDTLRCHTRSGENVFTSRNSGIVLLNSLAVAADVGTIVTGSREGRVALWSAATGELIEMLPDLHEKSVKSVAISPDGRRILSTSYDAQAYVWRRSAEQWRPMPLRWHSKPGVPTGVMTATRVYLGGWDGFVSEWSITGFLEEITEMSSVVGHEVD